ncbi:hypothetical protein BKA69DRAFT_1066182 [Paraphysoderma sedebokerense]|nr:hypothetical protein BKA69DRAFT_1066182 [Paraphysoderma sedebokerense]
MESSNSLQKFKLRSKMSSWEQFLALLSKNMKLRARSIVPTLMSLMVPIYVLFILIILQISVVQPLQRPETKALPFLTFDVCKSSLTCIHIAFTNSTPVPRLISQLRTLIESSESTKVELKYFPSRIDILDVFTSNPNSIVTAVDFGNVSFLESDIDFADVNITLSKIPTISSYTLLTNFSSVISSENLIKQKFITAQTYINTAIANTIRSKYFLPQLPPPFTNETPRNTMKEQLSLTSLLKKPSSSIVGMFSFYYTFALQSWYTNPHQHMATEFSNRSYSLLILMGLDKTIYIISSFVTFALTDLITVLIIFMISVVSKLFSLSLPIILLFHLILFNWNSVIIGIIASILIPDQKKSATIGNLMMVASLLVFGLGQLFVFDSAEVGSSGVKNFWEFLLLLIPMVGFARGIDVLARRETALLETNFSVLWQTDLLKVWGFLLLDLVLYFSLTWYLIHAMPSAFSRSLPFSFPFHKSYWFPPRKNHQPVSSQQNNSPFEDKPLLRITGLTKEYVIPKLQSKGSRETPFSLRNILGQSTESKKVVNGLSFSAMENEILGILGHNGAGKTTAISIIIGIIAPTDGKVEVMGLDMTEESLPAIQRSLGVCLQFDVLWEELTVHEHLEMFAAIKGLVVESTDGQLTGVALKQQYLDHLLADVYLLDKRNERVKTLSGGMKRKLSLAIALLGDPKIVVLDEPTTGMDIYTRKQIWQLIQDSRQGRTILLTTHSMEEADYLSSRIAIIASGKLQVVGTTLALKQKFGAGYLLVLTKGREWEKLQKTEIEQRMTGLLDWIKQWIPAAQLHPGSFSSHTISVALPISSSPSHASKTFKFSKFFKAWNDDTCSKRFNIVGVSLTMTTLEEVFVKLRDEDSSSNRDIQV